MTTEERQSIIDEIKKYIDQKFEEQEYNEIENLGHIITKHLNIDVDGYYDAYSGQTEHYHKVNIDWY